MIKVGGRFNVRVVQCGEHYGRHDCLTHDDARPMVEFYDADHSDADFGERGQFVSRYYLETLEKHAKKCAGGLQLDGAVKAWAIDQIDLRCAIEYARGVTGAPV